jgi:hypothetical protein
MALRTDEKLAGAICGSGSYQGSGLIGELNQWPSQGISERNENKPGNKKGPR